MDASERRKRAGAEAADWFARLQAGEMERSERRQFVEWLRESYIHVTEMLRIAQIHGELERFEHWTRISTGPKTDDDNIGRLPAHSGGDLQEPHPYSSIPRPSRLEPRRAQGRVLAIAAAVVLIAIAAVILPTIRGQVIETERGERREVVLSDGSVVVVDPETRLRVKYGDEVRRVFLERGRALFRVAKNANRPFMVRADDTTVRALGTAFGVEQQTRGVIVTVAEGKVAVFPASHAAAAAIPAPGVPGVSAPSPGPQTNTASESGSQGGTASPSPRGQVALVPENVQASPGALFLTADQQVTVSSSGATEPVREVDSHRALAWAEGRLIFQNDELGKVVAEFNRYNRVKLTVMDPELAAKPVSGVFNASDPEAFVAFLKSVSAVEIVRDGNRSITIVTAPRP
jgi:transmembrane sensor